MDNKINDSQTEGLETVETKLTLLGKYPNLTELYRLLPWSIISFQKCLQNSLDVRRWLVRWVVPEPERELGFDACLYATLYHTYTVLCANGTNGHLYHFTDRQTGADEFPFLDPILTVYGIFLLFNILFSISIWYENIDYPHNDRLFL